MFTITITSVIERLARTYLRHCHRPASIYIGSIDKPTEYDGKVKENRDLTFTSIKTRLITGPL
ncbi:unnamed protein product, partial [Rotaria sp. Silwood1]